MRLAPLVLVLAVGGLAACAGDQTSFIDDPLSDATAVAAQAAPITTIAPTTTTVALPTVPAPTESVVEPEPPTTLTAPVPTEPTTTTPAGPPTESEIRAALDPLFTGWQFCFLDPATCETGGFAVADSPLAVSIQDGARDWVAARKYLEPHSETSYSLESIRLLAPDLVKVTMCYVDYGWIREADTTPQLEDDVVLDDRIIAYRSEATLRGAPGDQLLLDYNRIASWPRETSCPAA